MLYRALLQRVYHGLHTQYTAHTNVPYTPTPTNEPTKERLMSTQSRLSLILLLACTMAFSAACGKKNPEPPKKIDFEKAEKSSENAVESVIPSPDQIFIAMSTLGDAKLSEHVTAVDGNKFDSESKTALVAGFHLAHFFVYVDAKDKDKASKAVDNIVASAKALDVTVDKDDLKKVRSDVKDGKWEDLRYNLSSLNGKVTDELIDKKNRPDLVTLISLGAWIEGAHVASAALSKKYSKKSAVVLQQHDLIKDVKKATKKSLKQDDKYTKIVTKNMTKLQKIMKSSDNAAPSEKQVKEIQELTSKARADILK